MDFAFSETQTQLREVVGRLLREHATLVATRRLYEEPGSFDETLWHRLAELGLLGIAIPEAHGGSGAGYLELCVVAEELGRFLAPVPFASSICLGSELIRLAGTEAQQRAMLPGIARGERIVGVALVEGPGNPSPTGFATTVSAHDGLHGIVWLVLDGDVATGVIVPARDGAGRLSLFLVDTTDPGVTRETLHSLDPSRGQARILLSEAHGERLGPTGLGWDILQTVLNRAAVLAAFEQIGGAEAALDMARGQALEREAFGRKIGSFQAIKHKLVDMWVAIELARSNAWFAAWALSADSPNLPRAAATARVSATQAHQLCTKENIQIHGGMGFTWDSDCHLHHRRAQLLALSLGGLSFWQDRLVHGLREEYAA